MQCLSVADQEAIEPLIAKTLLDSKQPTLVIIKDVEKAGCLDQLTQGIRGQIKGNSKY